MIKLLQRDMKSKLRPRAPASANAADTAGGSTVRLDSKDLFRTTREVEIVHDGRVYRLRLTQLNKLILTA